MGNNNYDIIIIGGGHAGCEAAFAAAKMIDGVLLLTGSVDALARMSCNPAVGGLAKGQLTKEIDALGGIMGVVTDETGLQFRLLNRSKGPAVQSTRVQCGRRQYELTMKEKLLAVDSLTIAEKIGSKLIVEGKKAAGIVCDDGCEYFGKAIIITSGTFLNGLIHIGRKNFQAGRINEKPVAGLTECLNELGIRAGRLKTGTPPRLDGNSIDYDKFIIQPGDLPPPHFSSRVRLPDDIEQLPCYLGYTNHRTHEILKSGLDDSPLFRGIIQGVGPRYCPSIEDKVVRFGDKERHQLFIEPEGLNTSEVYLNGFSSSLPEEIQYKALTSIPGLENVAVNRPGYAIEYDYFPSSQIWLTMESKIVDNLYFAGQVNGTSGYEEAAAQGLMAGVNAALKIRREEPFILKRSQAYIGVLIDDLTTRAIDEPYRMFTSRAEHRLVLREDNARERLSRYAYQYGLISKQEYKAIEHVIRKSDAERARLERVFVYPKEIAKAAEVRKDPDRKLSLADALRIPGVTEDDISQADSEFSALPDDIRKRTEIEIKYSGYIERQNREIARMEKLENTRIPADIDYITIKALKKEAAEKLQRFKPYTLGQASRIAGVSPGDISVLMVYIKRSRHSQTDDNV